jgi:HemY protein
LPKENLVKLLQAQVANISGDKDSAQKLFEDLTKTEEGQFIGYRGLISQAIAANEPQKALEIADQLLKDNPKSTWLNNALIDLGFRNNDWDKLEKYLRKAEANKSLTKEKIAEKFAVFYYMKAKFAKTEGRGEDAIWLAERALKYNEKFIPAAIFLAEIFNGSEDYKKTKALVEKFWKQQTSLELGRLYNDALTVRGEKAKYKQVKKLYEAAPDEVESSIIYAKALIADKQNDEARELIHKAQKIRETKLVCQTMAQIDDRVAWQNRAETALDDKFWYCKLTGARYPEWQLYSDSGELNTIVWDYPLESVKAALGSNKFLMLG